MNIIQDKRGSIPILRPQGQLTGDGAIVTKAASLIDRRGASVIIDLSEVPFVSSAGLGELVRITAQANSQGARVVLAAITPFVNGVLATTRLEKFFEVFPSVDQAVAAMK